MRTVKLQNLSNGNLILASSTATHGTRRGERAAVIVYTITDVPDGVSDQQVCELASKTTLARHLAPDAAETHVYSYGDLGEGKIAR